MEKENKTNIILAFIGGILMVSLLAVIIANTAFEIGRKETCEREVLSAVYQKYVEDLEYGSLIVGIETERLELKSVRNWYKSYGADEWAGCNSEVYKITVYYIDESDDKVKEVTYIAIIGYTPFKILDLDVAKVEDYEK